MRMCLVVLLAVGCGGGAGGSAGDPVGTSVMKVIGSSGGMVSTPAGAAIVIPAGALSKDTNISITATAAVPPSVYGKAVGVNYQFGPAGTLFLKPVSMNLPFGNLPSGVDASKDLQIFTAPDGSNQYTSLGAAKLIDSSHAGATTLHFSQCVVVAPPDGSGNTTGSTGGTTGGTTGAGQCTLSCAGSSSAPSGNIVDAGAPTGGTTGTSGGTTGTSGGTTGTTGSGGSSSTCGCQDSCNGSTYQMVCDGTNCTCIQNGVTTSMFAQGAVCGDTSSGWSSCGFPAPTQGGMVDAGTSGTPDASLTTGGSSGGTTGSGGMIDAGTTPPPDGGAMSCTPTCGGSASSCTCNENCNGQSYILSCNGSTCNCDSTTGTHTTFTEPTTGCTLSAFNGSCGFP